MWLRAFLFLCIVWLSLIGMSGHGKGTLEVRIDGLRNTKGQVLVSLYNRPEGFLNDDSAIFQSRAIDGINGERVSVRFENLDYGNYAIAVLHDENRSGNMEKKFLLLPEEGYALSNNINPGLTVPSWQECKLTLESEKKTIELQLIYLWVSPQAH